MCRWVAYAGHPVYLEQLLMQPQRSLVEQALRARKSVSVTNGDGFGVGWYGDRPEPGLYREDRPAWNDDNLRSLAGLIRSGHVFAHVRAATGGGSSRNNCHPFRLGRWLFMHNGQIGGYDAVARDLDFALSPELYRVRHGSTDSETLFLLAATFGLEPDPLAALARSVGFVEQVMALRGVTEPLRLTAALSDGQRIWAVRYASDAASPTLFHTSAGTVRDASGARCLGAPDRAAPAAADDASAGVVLASEPLDDQRSLWSAVPEGHALVVDGQGVHLQPWTPVRAAAGVASPVPAPRPGADLLSGFVGIRPAAV